MKSRHSHPLIIELDEIMEEFTPLLESFSDEHGFEFFRSEDGDFDPPHRTLRKSSFEFWYWQAFDFRVCGRDPKTNRPPDPSAELPLRLTAAVSAFCSETKTWKTHRDRIFDELPLAEVRNQLSAALQSGLRVFSDWPSERVIADGSSS